MRNRMWLMSMMAVGILGISEVSTGSPRTSGDVAPSLAPSGMEADGGPGRLLCTWQWKYYGGAWHWVCL